jgi:hypothetical protein
VKLSRKSARNPGESSEIASKFQKWSDSKIVHKILAKRGKLKENPIDEESMKN